MEESNILNRINELRVSDFKKIEIEENLIPKMSELKIMLFFGVVNSIALILVICLCFFIDLKDFWVFVVVCVMAFSFGGGLFFTIKQILKNSRVRMECIQGIHIKLIETERSLLNGKLMCFSQANEIIKLKKEIEDLRMKCIKLEKKPSENMV